MSEIIVLVGPPGSGKTSLAKEYESKGYIRVSQDDQSKQGHINLYWQLLEEKKNILIDRMGFSIEQRNRYLWPAKDAGYSTKIIVLHVPYEICLERCLTRKDHPTIKEEKDAKSALNTFFSKYDRVQDSDADIVERRGWETPNKEDAIWIDVDNTLSDASHREHFLQGIKKDWPGFFSAMSKDKVNEWCKAIAYSFIDSCRARVLICSARPDDYRKQTLEWLHDNNVPFDELLMRRRGDYRKDNIVKLQMYEFEIKPRYNLLFSVDDRKQVIDEIRNNGVIVLDCAGEKGNF